MTGPARRGVVLVVLVSVAVTVASLRNGFTLDDHVIVEANPMVQSPGGLDRILDTPYWSPLLRSGIEDSQAFGLYRPLTIASLAIDRRVLGPSPLGHHATNVILHALCSLLTAALLGRLAGARVGVLGGLLFAVHPVHAEVVASVVGRSELLCTLLVLMALLGRHRGREVRGSAGVALSTLALGCGFLALLAKENAVVLPALFLVLELVPVTGVRRESVVSRLAFVVLAGAVVAGFWFGLRMQVTGEVVTTRPPLLDNPTAHLPIPMATFTALRCLGLALRLLVIPVGQSADYSYRQIPPASALSPDVVAVMAVLVTVFVLVVRSLRKRTVEQSPGFTRGAILFLVAWLPVSNLLVSIGTIFAERLLYLPSAFFCLALASLLHAIRLRGRSVPVVAFVVSLALLSFLTVERCAVFRGDATLLPDLARRAPRSARARYATGNYLVTAEGKSLEAEQNLRAALWILPTQINPRLVLARLLRGQGHLADSLLHYRALRELRPDSGMVRAELGQVLLELGQEPAAERELQIAVIKEPGLALARHLLGRILVGRADKAPSPEEGARLLAEAVGHLRQALDRDPERWDIRYDRAVALERMSRWEEAARDYERVGRSAPGEMPLALARLAVCRLSLGVSGEELDVEVVAPVIEALRLAPGSLEIHRVAEAVLRALEGREASSASMANLERALEGASGVR